MADADYLVVDRPEDGRFALVLDGDDLGFTAYDRADGVITFTHTEVDSDLRERGLGSRLVAGALDAVRTGSQDRVVAECPFVSAFIDEHPDYADLLERTPPEGSPSHY